MKTRPSGDVPERLTPGAGAEAAYELEVEIKQNSIPFSRK